MESAAAERVCCKKVSDRPAVGCAVILAEFDRCDAGAPRVDTPETVQESSNSAPIHRFDHYLPSEILQQRINIGLATGWYVQRNNPCSGIDRGQRRNPAICFEDEFQEGDLPAINPVVSADGFHKRSSCVKWH